MVRPLIFNVICLFFLGAGALCAEEDARAILDVQGQINPRLGLAFPGGHEANYAKLAAAGLSVIRIDASWDRIEPKAGKFDFRGMDKRIKGLQSRGLTPFVTFSSNAKWATRPETQHVKNAAPKDIQLWARFVSNVVERYDGDSQSDMPGLRRPVRYFQAANEFMSAKNDSGGWAGSHEELLTYIDTAHNAVKSANRRSIFVLGGLSAFSIDAALVATGTDLALQQEPSKGKVRNLTRADVTSAAARDLLENRMKKVLRNARFDMVDVHLYGPEGRDAARVALAKRFSGRPAVSTECGGPSLKYGGRYSGHAHFVAAMERNLNVQADGLPFCLWFGLGEEVQSTYGNSRVPLYDKSRRPKPGVAAFRLLSRLLNAGATVKRTTPGRGFEIRHGGSRTTFVTLDPASRQALAARIGGDAKTICINDAGARKVQTLILEAAANSCDTDAVGLTGVVPFELIHTK